ncbi:hypothetical protein [Nocardioides mangrovi]|uniref:hypothetical protein n=1 Tax=Nocardioides mangrovi TaxID=2874580 RepID=UPI001CC69328|nr:hypothetical protein [Nocardioides mangrovi]
MLPPRFEAVGEALASGSGSEVACEVTGAALAREGWSLAEALDGLSSTTRTVLGREPEHTATRALAVAWSEAMLGYLHGLSCEDPLTGLASLAHLRTEISGLYRSEPPSVARDSHALVVVAAPPWPDAPYEPAAGTETGGGEVLARAMRAAQLGATTRTVFSGPETIGHVAPGRLVVLAGRDDRIGRRVGLLRTMLDTSTVQHTRVWIEGLPDTDDGAAALLDELARV